MRNDIIGVSHICAGGLMKVQQKPIARSLDLHYYGRFAGYPGCQLSNQPVAMVSHWNWRRSFYFCVVRWQEAFHRAFHSGSVNLSIHQSLHY